MATKLDLLARPSSEATAVAASSSKDDAKAAGLSFCNLPWDDEKVFVGTPPLTYSHRTCSSLQKFDGLIASKDMIKQRMLLIPENIVDQWSFCYPIMPFHDRIFVLKGGAFGWGNEVSAFTFDWRSMTAREIKSEDQEEGELVEDINHNSTHFMNRSVYMICKVTTLINLATPEATERLKRLDLSKMQTDINALSKELRAWTLALERKKRDLDPRGLKQGMWEQEQTQIRLLEENLEKRREDYKRKSKLEAKTFSFKTLIYEDLGPIRKASNLANIPLQENHLPLEEIGFLESNLLKNCYRTQSIALIRLIQLFKHLKSMPLEEGGLEEIAFKDKDVKKISETIDRFDKDSTSEEQSRFAYDLLMMGMELLIKLRCGSYYKALILCEESIQNLFLNPDREKIPDFRFAPDTNLYKENFSESVWGPLLSYEVHKVNETNVPLTLTVTINHEVNVYELLAFIDFKGVLYIFKREDDFILVSSYGDNVGDKILNLYVGGDTGVLNTLFVGTGTAFYRHIPSSFKRIKGIIPNV